MSEEACNNLRHYIQLCGGPTAVSKALKITRKTVYTWMDRGFPHTEYSGYTNHSKKIADLCNVMGFKAITEDDIFKSQIKE